jgi:threonine dehydratase
MIPSLDDFRRARERLGDRIRRTPIVRVRSHEPLDQRAPCDLLLKLECLQVSGSFKARGALSKVLSLTPSAVQQGIITASGGNHGLAVAYAGRAVGARTVVYLPSRTPEAKAARIAAFGADVVRAGDVWDDAHEAALARAASDGLAYIHPFADPEVVAGAGTIALEIFEDAPAVDLVLVAIGGGGLAAGVATATRHLRAGTRVIGVEPEGAPTLFESLRDGRVVELAEIRTAAGTLAPRKSDAYNVEILRETLERIVLVTDEEMRDAARFLWKELGIGAELSGAAALAAVLAGKVDLGGSKNPCVLVCGSGADGI